MEPLILYFVLFFPGIYISGFSGREAVEIIPFYTFRELSRTLTYTIPSIALLWFVIFGKKKLLLLRLNELRKKDLKTFVAGFSGLCLISLGISLLVSFFMRYYDLNPPPKVEPPGNIVGWIVLVLSCLGTGYLEESFFR